MIDRLRAANTALIEKCDEYQKDRDSYYRQLKEALDMVQVYASALKRAGMVIRDGKLESIDD